MTRRAVDFVGALLAEQRRRTVYGFDDEAARRDGAMRLIGEYVGNTAVELAEKQFARIRETGIGRLHFAGAGSLLPGKPHYYRIHGPTVVTEYDNSRDEANHAHSVWHDPQEVFGIDLLRRHNETAHHP